MRYRSMLITGFGLSLAVVGCAASLTTSPSRPSASQVAANTREITGQVASYTTAARGEMDGFILDTGNRVHFPVHTGSAILPLVGKGQAVRVVGQLVDRPDGKVIEGTSITNVDKGETLNVASVSPPRAPAQPAGSVSPPEKAQSTTTLTGAQLTSKEGRVQAYTSAPSGDMDGVLLDTGARVHFPTNAGKAVLPLVERGKSIRVIGWELTGPQGVVLEATKIIATPGGQTVDITEVAPPPAKTQAPGAVAPPGQPPLDSTSPPRGR